MTREEIKSNLYKTDYIRIALKCTAKGCDTDRFYVYKIVNGIRNAKKGKGRIILETAMEVAIENIKLKQAAINAQDNNKING